jgi:hypothetical protein
MRQQNAAQARPPVMPVPSVDQMARNKWSLDDVAIGDARQPMTAAAPRMPTVDDLLQSTLSAPEGRSLMPGVVQRGGVTNVVGVPSNSPTLDMITNERLNEAAIRCSNTATRVAANNQAQLARNADTLQSWGRDGDDIFTSGKQYVPGEGMKPISNYRAARNAMSPQQAQTFEEAKASRNADLELRKQRQFARAQFREAAAGRGAIYEDDGGLDLAGTIATRMAAANAPTATSFNARTGERSATYGNPTASLSALLGRDKIAEDGRQFDQQFTLQDLLAKEQLATGEWERSDKYLAHQLAMNGQGDELMPKMSPIEKVQNAINFNSELATNPVGVENELITTADQWDVLDESAQRYLLEKSAPSIESLLALEKEQNENPNFLSQMTPEQKAAAVRRAKALMEMRKMRGDDSGPAPKRQPVSPFGGFAGLGGDMSF